MSRTALRRAGRTKCIEADGERPYSERTKISPTVQPTSATGDEPYGRGFEPYSGQGGARNLWTCVDKYSDAIGLTDRLIDRSEIGEVPLFACLYMLCMSK